MDRPQYKRTDAVDALRSRVHADWPSIVASEKSARKTVAQLQELLAELTSDDTSVVVFGSVGRLEVTTGSDIDWTILVDGQADLGHSVLASECRDRLRQAGFKQPGPEGTFGDLAFSHALINDIGGQADSNANLTRRILLLLEATPIGPRDAYDRVIRGLLQRYLAEDYGFVYQRNPHGVPRFLQNDISRYWRTMAVDFAYKQWTRRNDKWALRSAKLRISRKVLYAAGLLFCFGCVGTQERWSDERIERAIEFFSDLTADTPLNSLAKAFLKDERLTLQGRDLFSAYDSFLELLNDKDRREELESLNPSEVDENKTFQEIRDLGHRVRAGLDAVFLDANRTGIPELVRVYGVF